MRDEYNIGELNPRKNPYIGRLEEKSPINIDNSIIAYFESMAKAIGTPCETLINAQLRKVINNQCRP